MKTLRKTLFFIALVLVLSLSACVQRLSPPEQPTPTTEGLTAVSPPATGVIDTIFLIATQTALASQGTPLAPVFPTQDLTLVALTSTAFTPAATAAFSTPVPPTAAPLGPAPTIIVPTLYVLNKGEHPYCLGRRFDINPADILAANGLSANSTLSVGARLTIPQNARPFPGNRALQPHPATYTVRANDTIYSIACFFGDVAPETVAWANNLTEPYRLTTGQVLNIP